MTTRWTLLFVFALLGAGCASLGDSTWDRVRATKWILTELEGEPALEDVDVLLRLEEDRRAFGHAGVNAYFGNFQRFGERLVFANVAATRRAGPPYAMQQEHRYLAALNRVERFELSEAELALLSASEVVLRFGPAK